MKKSLWLVCFAFIVAIFGVICGSQSTYVFATNNTSSVADFYSFEKQLMQVTKNDNLNGVVIDKTEDYETIKQQLQKLPQIGDGFEHDLSEEQKQIDWLALKNSLEYNNYYTIEDQNQITIYHKYALKRLVVFGEVKNTYGASQVISGYDDITVLCYQTQEQTENAHKNLINDNAEVYIDEIVSTASYSENVYDYSDNLNWGAEAIDIGGYREYLDDKAITTSKQTVVVVIDTGLNTGHTYFKNRMVKDGNNKVVGYSYCTTTYTYSGYDFEDDHGHGTHVAGIIADLTPENVKILPIRVLNTQGKGSSLNIMAAVVRVYEVYANSYHIACINMSLGGGYSKSSDLQYYDAFDKLRQKNILPVVAAGNEEEDASNHLPAATDNAITVSALKKSSQGYEFDLSYSNYGEDIDISAPGSSIYSTCIGSKNQASNAYATKSGTSMATPQVAGAVALLCLDPIYYSNGTFNYTAEQIEQRLYDLAIDLGDKGWDEYYGHGMVNVRYFEGQKSEETISFYKDGELIENTQGYIEFEDPFELDIKCSDPSFKIYYTTDYFPPKAKTEKQFVDVLTIEDTTVLYAVACKFEGENLIETTNVFRVAFFYVNGNIEDYFIIDQDGDIISYTGHFRDVIVPEYIDGLQVKGIYRDVFLYCDAVSITLPESCTTAGGYAFMQCRDLQYVYAPGITKLYTYAFAFNQKLTFVTSDKPQEGATHGVYLPKLTETVSATFYDCEKIESVKLENLKTPGAADFSFCTKLSTCELPNATIIPSGMLYNCPGITTFKIGKNVQSIEDAAFGKTKITGFSVESGNSYIYTDGIGVYTTDTLAGYAVGSSTKNYEIKSSVKIGGVSRTITTISTEVMNYAELETLTIPSTITTIYNIAFDTVYYNATNCGYEGYFDKEEMMVGAPFYKSRIKNFIISAGVKLLPERFLQWSVPEKVSIMSAQTQFASSSMYVIDDEDGNAHYYDMYFEFDAVATKTLMTQLSSSSAFHHLTNLFVRQKSSEITTAQPSYMLRGSYDEYFVYSKTARTIKATTDGNGSITPSGDVAILKDGERSFVITPDSGYVIESVLVNGKNVGSVSNYTVVCNGSNQTIEVVFTDKAYFIEASSNAGGEISPKGKTNYKENATAVYTITPKLGFIIKDVIVDEVSVGPVEKYEFKNITENHTIQAVFEKITFTIQVEYGQNGKITPDGDGKPLVVGYGDAQTFNIVADKGYRVKEVWVDGESQGAITTYTFSIITENHTISAEFERVYLTIEITCGGNGTVSPTGTHTIAQGEDFDVIIMPNTGYKIKQILINGKTIEPTTLYIFESVMENQTMAVEFERITFTITIIPGRNGTIAPNQVQTVEYGSSMTFTITPDTGYIIKNVYVNGHNKGQNSTCVIENITANQTISAEFEKQKFAVNIVCDIGGSVSPDSTIMLEYGQNKNFIIVPDEGYRIKDVLLDGTSVGCVSTYQLENVTGSHTLSATFERIKLNIIIQAEGKGSVTLANGSTVEYGQSVTLNFIPDENQEVKMVYANGRLINVVGDQATIQNVTEDQIITVKFAEKTNVMAGVIVVGVVVVALAGVVIYFVIKRKNRMF